MIPIALLERLVLISEMIRYLSRNAFFFGKSIESNKRSLNHKS